jgi:hypothetical protein
MPRNGAKTGGGRSQVEKKQTDWIDPAAARRLLLEYRQALRVKGGSEIERQINTHTRLGISRKTIENWLNDADSVPSPQTLKIVLRFLQTAHFQDVVPRTRDYLESDTRFSRRGTALFPDELSHPWMVVWSTFPAGDG